MTPEEADVIIEGALRPLGNPETINNSYFYDVRFGEIPWLPTYIKRVAGRVWSIELCRGDRISDVTVRSMFKTREIDGNVQPAFFVPEGEPYDHLLPICRAQGFGLIVKAADEYEALVFAGPEPLRGVPVLRIPQWILEEISSLSNLDQGFIGALKGFRKRYLALIDSGRISDETQDDLIKRSLKSLLNQDERFVADFTPLDLMKFLELTLYESVRDHYFHTFNNFLLGCIVIDRCHNSFAHFRQSCHLQPNAFSIEYVWLLTVLFHDVGYPIQKMRETSKMIFGVDSITDEQVGAERGRAWETPEYRMARGQLVSMFDYLTQDDLESSWSADPYPLKAGHPLDVAFAKSFTTLGHAVASSMRMLAEFYKSIPESVTQHRQFLLRHVFLAGVSIPFHDWPVRKFLREVGITRIRTSRFPFASLLMFIDSIQEDRRGRVQEPDVLSSISVVGNVVSAEMELGNLSADKQREKQREAKDVQDFLNQDGLQFQYPTELL